MTVRGKLHPKKADVYATYRRLLMRPHLTKAEIDAMREHLSSLACTICEHVWRQRFY